MNELFPIFLKADQIELLLIGGGEVAAEKLHFLLKSSPDAKLTVVAKKVSTQVRNIAENFSGVTVEERSFNSWDVDGKNIVTGKPLFGIDFLLWL